MKRSKEACGSKAWGRAIPFHDGECKGAIAGSTVQKLLEDTGRFTMLSMVVYGVWKRRPGLSS